MEAWRWSLRTQRVQRDSRGQTVTATMAQTQSQAQSDYESSGGNIMDLGCIIKPSMTTLKEVCDAIDKLDNGQKYKPLTEHFKPTFSSGCNRSFQYRRLEKYPWLVYSKQLDLEFCKFCDIFARNRETPGVLVNKPFSNWVKVNNHGWWSNIS